ncbi:MAG: hypothetical protein H7328_12105 [Bdellovibrio sp.]|nr:hypothetical protein [Bdellovibrio sp.]
MKLKTLLKLSVLELIRFRKITSFLIFNFTLGLVGFFLLQIFQQSLSAQTAEKAQVVLGGDISINARRAFSEAEIKTWEAEIPFTEKTHFYSLFSMLRTKTDARLTSVGVFDSNYPLYGKFKLSNQGFSSDKARVWVDPEIQEILELKLADLVDIGEAQFEYSGTIVEDPSRLFRGAGFAPRVLIHSNYLAASQLIKPGSTFSENWIYKLPPKQNIAAIKNKVEKIIKDPVVQIESVADSEQDSNRVLKYFTDYLGLVALVALGLCFLCGSYLLQWTFQTKKKSIAIFKTLGLSDRKILAIYLLQSLIIAVVSCLLCILFVRLVLPGMQSLVTNQFQLPIELSVDLLSLIIISLVGIMGPLLMTVPQILQIFELQALELFQNASIDTRRNKLYYFWLAFSLALFWALSVWQSHSVKVASGFVGALVFLIILFSYLNRFILFLLEKSAARFSWLTRYAIKGLTRRAASTSLVFTTMSLATLVLSLLPHLKSSILSEIRPQQTSQIPQLFLFDIQPEQVSPLQKISENVLAAKLKFSPLVRSRILKINDQPYERIVQDTGFQTRESENEARFRNRGVNLTYSDTLQPSEVLVAGTFSGVRTDQNELPQISLEEKYAERVGVKIGDLMTFDVQGTEMQAQVSSLRQVRWTSFQPNFFILFPKGVLEDAPQIFLTSVSQEMNPVKKFQQEVVQKFKNVSVIDVSKTIQNSLKYIDQMSLGLQMMAWLAVSVGLFVFIILLNTQIRERLQEMNLVQILGATEAQIRKAIFIQFFVLMSISIASGILLGLIAAKLLLTFLFNISTVYDWQYLVFLAGLIVPISFLAIYFGLKPLQKLNPMDLIRQS